MIHPATCPGSVFGPMACSVCERGETMDSNRHAEALESQQQSLCERMDRSTGEGVGFERTRRITGYLSPVRKWNNAKRAELKDRVKHG